MADTDSPKPLGDADDLVDRHRGDDATITLPLRTVLDLWMMCDQGGIHDEPGFNETLEAACRAAGVDGTVEAFHRCGPGMLTSADGKVGRRLPPPTQ